jgi:hypothetical protein
MPQTTDVPYDTTPDPAFVAGVVAFPWQPWVPQGMQIGWVASGECPRCHHTMAVYRRRVRGFLPPRAISLACNCAADHPNRPADLRQGCGQFGAVEPRQWPLPGD